MPQAPACEKAGALRGGCPDLLAELATRLEHLRQELHLRFDGLQSGGVS
jgi:hypothetical protein